ncbi:MAG: lipopolysaccharide biosynthesis protein [Rhodothalassiaceae bacterium]
MTDATSSDRQMARGGAWMVLMRWTMRGIGLLSTLILARLLTPADFGVIAMAMIVVGLLEILAQTGVDLAIIREKDPRREDFDSAWTLQIMISLAVGLMLVLSAPFAAAAFDEPKIEPVIQALALRSLLSGFTNVGTIEFRRRLDFRTEFHYNIVKRLANFAIVVTAALILRNYWALVIGMIAAQIVEVGISYLYHPYRPRLCFARVKALFSFSAWLIFYRIARYFSYRIDQFVVGGFAGTAFMGNYYVAYDLATSPTNELVVPMGRGLYPVYARLKDDPPALVAAYLKALGTVTLLLVPLGFGLAAVAPDAVPVLLGAKWHAAIPLVEILAVFGVFFGISNTIEVLLTVIGRVRLLAALSFSQIGSLALALYLVAKFVGVDAIAAVRCAVAILTLPFVFLVLRRVLPIGVGATLRALWPPLAAGLVMVACVLAVQGGDLPSALRLVLEIGAGALSYTAAVLAIWYLRGSPDGAEKAAVDWCRRRLVPRAI